MLRATSLATLLVWAAALPAAAQSEGWPRAIARAQTVAVYADADDVSPVLTELAPYEPLGVVEVDGDWCRIQLESLESEGWVPADRIVISAGVGRFWEGDYEMALPMLEAEAQAESDDQVRTWLRFFAGYASWASGATAHALEVFEGIAASGHETFAPFAHIARAKILAQAGDFAGSAAAYRALLDAFPGFAPPTSRVPLAIDTYPSAISRGLLGNRDIELRIRVLEDLASATAEVERLDNDATARADARAAAWLRLARLQDQRAALEPQVVRGPDLATGRRDAAASYRRVMELAPGSADAGHAEFRLIEMEEPATWRGDWVGQAAWELERFGGFLQRYPDHERAGDALLRVALATWAAGGFPEVFGLVLAPSIDQYDFTRSSMIRWFVETESGIGFDTPARDPSKPREAADLLRRIVDFHPDSPAASSARYYLAVVHEYVFGEIDDALQHYLAFADLPDADPVLLEKARDRIRELSVP